MTGLGLVLGEILVEVALQRHPLMG
jgi:hypothetical protein